MKVKKLLTLLLVAGAMSACQLNGATNNSGSSDNNPSTQSPSSDSSLPDNSSEDSSAASSDSSADQSSSDSSSSSSEAPTLASIAVTAPTKVDYLTSDTELDLAGMVVTATMSDGSTQAVASGYEVGQVDFSTPGQKDVTVTYQGKSDSFQITVSQAKPTAWSDDVVALFAESIYAYDVPFFYGPDYNVGELTWESNEGTVTAEGDALPAQEEGAESPLKPIADIFIADGFVPSVQPDPTNNKFHYVMEKAIDVENAQRFIQIRIATLDGEGYFVNGGDFYFEIRDPYFYSWEETGFEALIKGYEKFADETLPVFPAGARFLKNDLRSVRSSASSGYAKFSVYGLSVEQVNAFLAGLAEGGWLIFDSPRRGFEIDGISPSKVLRIGGAYNATSGVLTVAVDEAPTIAENVAAIAAIFEVEGLGYAFSYSSSSDSYYYQIEETLGEGGTLGSLLTKYTNVLTAGEGNDFAIRGERKEQSDGSIYEKYYSPSLESLVTIFAFEVEGKYYIQITVADFIPVPDLYLPTVALLGLDEGDFNVVPPSLSSAGYVWIQLPVAEGKTDAEGLKAFTDLLDADETLNYKVIQELAEVPMQGGGTGLHVVYANNNTLVDMYAFSGTIQISIEPYTPPVETEWSKKVLETIAGVDPEFQLEWDNDNQNFSYQERRPLGEGETLVSVVNAIAVALYDDDSLNLIFLADDADATECKVILCSNQNDGSITISYSDGAYIDTTTGDPLVILEITVILYDQEIPFMVNAIGSAMEVNMSETTLSDGVTTAYISSYGVMWFGEDYSSLADYGPLIMQNYLAAKLTSADALGFTLSSLTWSGNDLVGILSNEDGYRVQIYMKGYSGRVYSGYYQVLIIPPAEGE